MSIEVKVPGLPESVADAKVITWHKKAGDSVTQDETLVDLETDKVVLEVPAPETGVLKQILKPDGSVVVANDLLALIEQGASVSAAKSNKASAKSTSTAETAAPSAESDDLSPSVRRLIAENSVNPSKIPGTGKEGRITKEDVLNYLKTAGEANTASPVAAPQPARIAPIASGERIEKRVPMSRMRARIAERLLSAQHQAAILTTFNEINLKNLIELRAKYKDSFEKQHGVKLGFMSFFTKAVVEALKRFPSVNASIDGTDVVYHGYYDIGIAVSTERGLVVPIVRNADELSFAEIEKAIQDFSTRARNNQITMEDMTGGTFSITNGGVFGSMMATPIINPPQTGILGMHAIIERPIAENGQVVIRPMMYVALSYDHRLIDGKESVQFLVTVKQLLEDPSRLMLGV